MKIIFLVILLVGFTARRAHATELTPGERRDVWLALNDLAERREKINTSKSILAGSIVVEVATAALSTAAFVTSYHRTMTAEAARQMRNSAKGMWGVAVVVGFAGVYQVAQRYRGPNDGINQGFKNWLNAPEKDYFHRLAAFFEQRLPAQYERALANPEFARYLIELDEWLRGPRLLNPPPMMSGFPSNPKV